MSPDLSNEAAVLFGRNTQSPTTLSQVVGSFEI